MDSIQEIKIDVKELRKEFSEFRLKTAVDVALIDLNLTLSSRKSAKMWGLISGSLSSIAVGLLLAYLNRAYL